MFWWWNEKLYGSNKEIILLYTFKIMFLKEICAGGVLGIYITGYEMFESPWIKAFYINVFFLLLQQQPWDFYYKSWELLCFFLSTEKCV